jgi:Tfp pilus assembly protein PilV
MIVETLVAALLVAVMAVAFFGALDSSARVSGTAKARATAAALAQDDQERLRSMPVVSLSKVNGTTTKTVAGVNYDVSSKTDWIADATQSNTDCTANGATADFLRITTTVTAKNLNTLKPVVVTSTVTPAPGTFNNQGGLVVSVIDRNGAGLVGRTVNITGPVSTSAITNAQGCAFFGYQPVGDYTVSTSAVGYVDTAGNSTATTSVKISNETTATAQLQYDLAGQAAVSFETLPYGATTPTVTSNQWLVSWGNGTILRKFGPDYPTASPYTSPASMSSINATKLFPFAGLYGVYAGNCVYNDPAVQTPPQSGNSLQVLPGKLDHTITVFVPSLNVVGTYTTTTLNNAPTANLRVVFTSKTPNCGAWSVVRTTNAAGKLDDAALPYGTYDVCVDNSPIVGAASARKNANNTTTGTLGSVANTARAGTATKTINVKTASGTGQSPTGTCP